MNQKVYFDSTIPSYLFDERPDILPFVGITKDWWNNESENYDIYISRETIIELSQGNYQRKEEILKFIATLEVLNPNPQILEIAQIYMDNYLMPKDLEGDAIHLTYASYYKIDYLLTWNCNHLANANKNSISE